jgi:hypothetical protein
VEKRGKMCTELTFPFTTTLTTTLTTAPPP